jgi:hypothetical protein
VFDADGEPIQPSRPYALADHADFLERGGSRQEYLDGYAGQVSYLNGRILDTVDRLRARPGRPPVIIIQGDHGSRAVTAEPGSTDFLLEKVAILNAYHLPGAGGPEPYASITPANSFRIVLSRYLGVEPPSVADRVFWAEPDRPLDVSDVTEITRVEREPAPASAP